MPSINIYKIKFVNNEKEYIGATKLNLSSRKASFKRDMRKIYGNENNLDNMTDFYKNIYNGVKNTISLINKLDYDDKSEITVFIDNLIKNNNVYEKITSKKSKITDKKAVAIFTRLLLNGKIREATRFITERQESGGVMLPHEDAIKPAGKTVL